MLHEPDFAYLPARGFSAALRRVPRDLPRFAATSIVSGLPPVPGRPLISNKFLRFRIIFQEQQAVRGGLAMCLHLEPDIQIVGEASTGREALSLVPSLSPDVVLMDIEMPEMDGIEAIAALCRMVS